MEIYFGKIKKLFLIQNKTIAVEQKLIKFTQQRYEQTRDRSLIEKYMLYSIKFIQIIIKSKCLNIQWDRTKVFYKEQRYCHLYIW